MPRWDHFPHGADVGIRGLGETPAVAFAQAALALTAVITELSRVEARDEVDIEVARPRASLEDLFYDWIDALVFEMSTRRMLFSHFEVEIAPSADSMQLHARAFGEPVDPRRHEPAVEVKGPTFTRLRVSQDPPEPLEVNGWWRAECVVDV